MLLPREGDRVKLTKGGKVGKVVSLRPNSGVLSYEVHIESDAAGSSTVLQGSNLSVLLPENEEPASLHMLIPCHVETERRLLTFMRAAKSVDFQLTHSPYSIFVGISGPEKFRKEAAKSVATLAFKPNSRCRWYLQDDQVTNRPQMEHLRTLLLEGSIPTNPKALLTFLDNDDMCHPLRIRMLQDAYGSIPTTVSGPFTLALPCKLVLDPSFTASEGALENFVSPSNPRDFLHWRRQTFSRNKVKFASNEDVEELDCEEYFDFIVPTSVLKQFFDLTPPKVAAHPFCDLRLYQIFNHMAPVEMSNIGDPNMWLLAHYKVPMEEKWRAFDNHGQHTTSDQLSFSPVQPQKIDNALSKKYPQLSPQQIAMCRGHLESIILSYIGWNDDVLAMAQRAKIMELVQSHGNVSFASELWDECQARIRLLFDETTLRKSKGAWISPDLEGGVAPNHRRSLLILIFILAIILVVWHYLSGGEDNNDIVGADKVFSHADKEF
jgi:hypothetical protein